MNNSFDAYMDCVKAAIKAVIEPFKRFLDVFSSPLISFMCVCVVFAAMLAFCIFRYRNSFKAEIKKPKTLIVCALMMAINIILSYYEIRFGAYLRIGFGFVTQPIVTAMFGPIPGCMTGMLQDILSFILHPTGAYIPAYTMCVGISGMIYGIMLYNKPVTFARVFLTKLIIVVFSNIILNTVALAPTVGSGFAGIFPARLIKNILLLPVQAIIVYLILKYIMPHMRRQEGKV